MIWSKLLLLFAQGCLCYSIPKLQPRDLTQACGSLNITTLPGFRTLDVTAAEVRNYTNPLLPRSPAIDFCNVTVVLAHATSDRVLVQIWLPLENWNGRFLATGGGGLQAGYFDTALAPVVAAGFASGSTNAGLDVYGPPDSNKGDWSLNPDNSINWGRAVNFAYRSIHDMTTVGKAAVEAFYGTPPNKSYYSGCSTGGRQGYFAAYYYPEDFDGIMANAPAIHSPEIGGALFYPAVVMNNIVAPTQCVFQAFQNATIAQCDSLDGVTDGLISDLSLCNFDPQTLVGTQIECGGTQTTITDEHAEVVSLIYRGPRRDNGDFLWYGVPPGASFGGLANTTNVNGTVIPAPFGAAENFVRYMILQDPSFNTSAITFTEYERIHDQAIATYAPIMGNEYPDLEGFRKAGGKLLTFHGLADQAIPPEGTTLFRDRLAEATGGQDAVDEFYRVFFGPGAGHCGGGYGPWPDNELAVLINWVENGVAPDVLPSTLNRTDGTSLTRNICRYPQQLRYVSGDVSVASSFTCA